MIFKKMINSLCESSMGSLKKNEAPSSKQSPTASVSESNIVASADVNPNAFPELKFEVDLDVEVQSPDSSIWESLFADQINASPDFMVSSPRRDFMLCSPKRDYMVSSPQRDYMVSSPKRDFAIVSSPKRSGISPFYNQQSYCYASPSQMGTSGVSQNKGKSQSSLCRVFSNTSTCSSKYAHGENLALPVIDAFYDEYGREEYGHYASTEKEEFVPETEVAVGAAELPTLLDCLMMPSSSGFGGVGDAMGPSGIQSGGEGGIYQMGQFESGLLHHGQLHQVKEEEKEEEEQQGREVDAALLLTVGAKSELVVDSYQGLLGPMQPLESDQEQDSGLQLVHLLLACAEAVSKDDYLSARRYFHHLNRIVSPLGDSMQRVAACFSDALAARLAASSVMPKPSHDILKDYQILYQACPYIKFAHFTANQAIFEAFEAEDRVHVIDLDILQGYQWPAFMQALAARPGGPPSLRITGVGFPPDAVRDTGRHLADLARSLRVPFEFHAVGEARLEDLRPHMLGRRVGEALAVNSIVRLHRVAPGQIGALIGMIRDQAPNIVTVVEQEASHNSPHFLGRFLEALHYYSAIFDSLDATFPSDSAARARVEQYIFAPEIQNIVACEGAQRVERHERVERWRRVMEGKGFKVVPLSANAIAQSEILLSLYSCDGYRLTEDTGCLLLGWQDRPIIAASAWRC